MQHPVIVLLILFAATNAVEFYLTNYETKPIWVGIQAKTGHLHLSHGGLVLNHLETKVLSAASNWAGIFWARTYCTGTTCETGDCGRGLQCNGAAPSPPVTIADISLQSGTNGNDQYYISLVNGYNVKMSVQPVDGLHDGSKYNCWRATCSVELSTICPPELTIWDQRRNKIACNNACGAFKTNEYCCLDKSGQPLGSKCDSTNWSIDYPFFFKSNCPDADSYAGDKAMARFSCQAEAYNITFGY